MEDMQHVGYHVSFLQTLKVACLVCLAATCFVLLTPRDTTALSLSETLKQLAKVKDSLKLKANNGNKTHSFFLAKQQSKSSRTVVAASEPTPTPQPVATVTPQAPPVQQALPPEVELAASMSSIPSRRQLLSLVSEPLMISMPFNPRTVGDYYPSADSFAVLRPSTEGWKLLGISWIWWVAGSAVIWLGNRWLKWDS